MLSQVLGLRYRLKRSGPSHRPDSLARRLIRWGNMNGFAGCLKPGCKGAIRRPFCPARLAGYPRRAWAPPDSLVLYVERILMMLCEGKLPLAHFELVEAGCGAVGLFRVLAGVPRTWVTVDTSANVTYQVPETLTTVT